MPNKLDTIPIPADKESVFNAMVEYFESKIIRFNREMLDQYVNMRLPVFKSGARPGAGPEAPRTTMSRHTLIEWCRSFLKQYNNR